MAESAIDVSKAAAYAKEADESRRLAAVARDQAIATGGAIAAIRESVQAIAAQAQAWLGQGSVGYQWVGTVLEILSPNGEYGPGVNLKGNTGWSPILAIVNDGSRRVLQLADWGGGTGDKPAGAGKYVGPSGLVTDIDDAINIASGSGSFASEAQVITANHTAEVGDFLACDTTIEPFTLTMPADAEIDDIVVIEARNTSWRVNPLTVTADGEELTIDGLLSDDWTTPWRAVLIRVAGGWITKEFTLLFPFVVEE